MLAKAKERGTGRWILGDAEEPSMVSPKTYSHIFCMYFTLYCFKDTAAVLRNFYGWLRPGGYALIHIVNPERFDPILDAASPFPAFSLQKYANRRITSSEVAFDKFKYQCRFQKDPTETEASFDEIFKLPDGTQRRNRHTLHMPSIESIRLAATQTGFRDLGWIDLLACHFEYQYILVLQR
jgi:SAM-dependent methyltransferase